MDYLYVSLLALVVLFQVWNQYQIRRTVKKNQILEDRILARLLMEESQPQRGNPITLEDLIRLDLEEKMSQANQPQMAQDIIDGLMEPATEEELLSVLKERAKTYTK